MQWVDHMLMTEAPGFVHENLLLCFWHGLIQCSKVLSLLTLLSTPKTTTSTTITKHESFTMTCR